MRDTDAVIIVESLPQARYATSADGRAALRVGPKPCIVGVGLSDAVCAELRPLRVHCIADPSSLVALLQARLDGDLGMAVIVMADRADTGADLLRIARKGCRHATLACLPA